MRCPRCGSTRLAVVAGEQIQLKCLDCGYTWIPQTAPTGYMNIGNRVVHWTEVEVAKEKALSELRDLLENVADCGKIRETMAKYRELLGDSMLRIASAALTQAEPRIRLRGQSFLAKYRDMVVNCILGIIKGQ